MKASWLSRETSGQSGHGCELVSSGSILVNKELQGAPGIATRSILIRFPPACTLKVADARFGKLDFEKLQNETASSALKLLENFLFPTLTWGFCF